MIVDSISRVLIVDDSAYVRKVLKEILSRSPFLEVVGAARNGVEALELVEQLNPDVVTLDLIMPQMDGLTFLREQMKRRPLPVVIVSITSESGELMIKAMEAGAVDMVQKPTALANERVFDIAAELMQKVKAAAGARAMAVSTASAEPAVRPFSSPGATSVDIVVIGISTGGPQALKFMIQQFPADFPVPIAMVLHMPVGYTDMYARGLALVSKLRVAEAQEGDPLLPGTALLAAAGRHLVLRRNADGAVSAHLPLRPIETPHRPAVDVLFRSAAEVYGSRVLGVVMTGMGSDGTEGAAWIKAQGGRIFTEAEETCVVYGMPRAVVEAGLSDRRVPLTRMVEAILETI
jgi:two-component system chemotaxis response regulator CheB